MRARFDMRERPLARPAAVTAFKPSSYNGTNRQVPNFRRIFNLSFCMGFEQCGGPELPDPNLGPMPLEKDSTAARSVSRQQHDAPRHSRDTTPRLEPVPDTSRRMRRRALTDPSANRAIPTLATVRCFALPTQGWRQHPAGGVQRWAPATRGFKNPPTANSHPTLWCTLRGRTARCVISGGSGSGFRIRGRKWVLL